MKNSIIALLVVLSLSCSVSNNETKDHKLAGNALGTTYHITYLGEEIPDLEVKIDSILVDFNRSLSTYQENSLISAFNNNTLAEWKAASNPITFKNDLEQFNKMVNLSKAIAKQTEGAFDPSAGRLFAYYNQCKKEKVWMDADTLSSLLETVGMDKITSDGGVPKKLNPSLTLNFNAIAKGYLVDVIADFIAARGTENYLVEVGGEMRVQGMNAENELWKVGINIPKVGANPNHFFKVLDLENTAVATSGNYQNFYVVDSVLIGHTLNPSTGKAVTTNLKSATILHAECAVADAMATACMVMGLEEARKQIENNSNLSAYFIYEVNNELKGVFVD
jgi:thiamine biosynthesis lipoprotein